VSFDLSLRLQAGGQKRLSKEGLKAQVILKSGHLTVSRQQHAGFVVCSFCFFGRVTIVAQDNIGKEIDNTGDSVYCNIVFTPQSANIRITTQPQTPLLVVTRLQAAPPRLEIQCVCST
jgi:hypothetical protein